MGNRDFKIRAARHEDADALAALMRALHAHLKEPTEHISAEALLRDVLCKGSIYRLPVAEQAGRLVGYALTHESYESIYAQRGVYMADLFVAEEARRQGIARALVAHVAQEARARGLRFIWWVSEAWDERAQTFYASLGANHDEMIAHGLSFKAFEALADEGEKRGS